MNMFLDVLQNEVQDIYELDEIVECGELVKCIPGGKPFIRDDVSTTHYWVKDCNGREFKLLVLPYMMWAYELVGKKKAKELTEDFMVHQAVVLNELMCKIFGVNEYCDREELKVHTLNDIRKVWEYALIKFPYKGQFELGTDRYMFGR